MSTLKKFYKNFSEYFNNQTPSIDSLKVYLGKDGSLILGLGSLTVTFDENGELSGAESVAMDQ